ncbi:hypothetical protein PILCRDRAFT_820996 [Piloderma croceum F 1598]|uniref:F-box domain-containing protein n=1 Tax=Piloderma croceum (strain F 1598) TaxID=765440 RepID=A0A0C3B7A3_PILCF|nr:hypothetical protein PILCRDRAFT_820996 [Piloderma croceum F 1598]
MAPLTRLRKRNTCYFVILPNELFLIVSGLLGLKDRLALADTCSACRSLISDTDCRSACVKAGLSIPTGICVRAMAKLLVRPRVGVCNWSSEGGRPREKFNFSKVWSTSLAIRNAVKFEGHPTLVTQSYLFLRETKRFQDVRLRVAPNKPQILLWKNRLYMHEYLTHPPLRKLRVYIKEDEGPLDEDGDVTVAFVISNPEGVTLGNYWQGLYNFFYQAPFSKMPLTEQVVDEYWDFWTGRPFDPFAGSDTDSDESSASADSDSESDENPYFDRDCPTNLAMLDMWCKSFCEDISFSRKALHWEHPLYTGTLEAVIHVTEPKTARDIDLMRSAVWGGMGEKYGEPRRAWQSPFEDLVPPCDDYNKVFWRRHVPFIQF